MSILPVWATLIPVKFKTFKPFSGPCKIFSINAKFLMRMGMGSKLFGSTLRVALSALPKTSCNLTPPQPYLLQRTIASAPDKKKQLSRHNYHEECECYVNAQIAAELQACYAYLAIAAYFGRGDVALPGCYAFFFGMHLEELGHMHGLMRYQNMRGGCVRLETLPAPFDENTPLCIEASFMKGLEMEKQVKEKLYEVVKAAEKHKDYGLADFITAEYIQGQERSIQEYSRWIRRYQSMAGSPCGDYLFDKELHNEFAKAAMEDDVKLKPEEKAYK